ncbi:hypothetical protein Ocin01_14248 [Orchesella cincta]|uniref:Uncharacterized protein n=1 Tax=Orchesella cincta TaxID=48709 RepID=A0A1D2MHK7_ORCCI|nr:hypothetical protein Ocin01_14248 [Orchesella cincta]
MADGLYCAYNCIYVETKLSTRNHARDSLGHVFGAEEMGENRLKILHSSTVTTSDMTKNV